ncbi:MAG: epoxyqueuosine reductase [Oscillospiraceae bacterium]|nr:epoxyqueuosine reductase [Oscillospiraceae bacterium]
MKGKISKFFEKHGLNIYGFCRFDALSEPFKTRNACLIPENAKSVITFLFPYKTPAPKKRNLSLYCIGLDYHTIIQNKLSAVCSELSELFPKNTFVSFCDNSPIHETQAAYLSGLGYLGKNSLIIHRKYGSFCFIGEIVTDLEFDSYSSPLGFCLGCGECLNACAGGALKISDGQVYLLEKESCVSHITQKKGALTERQVDLISENGLVWGCDNCSIYCPMNKQAEDTYIDEFYLSQMPVLSEQNVDDISERAYAYKGKEILLRNLGIIGQKGGNNKGK